MPLARHLAITLFLITLVVGSLLVFSGLFMVTICSEPGGCRPDITWPILLPGIVLVAVSLVVRFTALRSKSGPS